MKLLSLLLVAFLSLFNLKALCQGVELMPEKQYNKLASPPTEAGAGTQKMEYTIPQKFFPPPGDQGGNNSCVGWAIGYAYLSYIQNAGKLENTYGDQVFSPWYLYKFVKNCSDCKCGIRIDKALDFLKYNGNVPISTYPYNPNDCTKPLAELKNIANHYKIKDWKRTEDLLNLAEIKSYLLNDIPIIVVIRADSKFKEFKDVDEKKPFEWANSIDFEYHAAVVVGYSDIKQSVKILNSYGSNWGSHGYAWITYESFRQMIKEAFVIPNNEVEQSNLYATVKNTNSENVGASNQIEGKQIESSDFKILGDKEFVRKNRFHFTFKISASPNVLSKVKKVIYNYDDPSFINKTSTSLNAPYFSNSYDASGCIEKMGAKIYLTNDSIVMVNFNGCEVVDDTSQLTNINPTTVDIIPHVTAKAISKGNYVFKIELRGLAPIKSMVDSVIYYWNHPTFKKPKSIAESSNGFSSGYSGWGCLTNMRIIIYFKNEYQKVLNVNMCQQIGWTDK